VTGSELPTEATEADVLEQHTDAQPEQDPLPVGDDEPDWEANPADVAEQEQAVGEEDEYAAEE